MGQTKDINDFLGTLLDTQPKKNKSKKPATSAVTKQTRIASYKKTDKQPLRQLVLDTLEGNELTAREIAVEMHARGLLPYPARSIIQPRITELAAAGIIAAVGVKTDTETDRKVAVYKVV